MDSPSSNSKNVKNVGHNLNLKLNEFCWGKSRGGQKDDVAKFKDNRPVSSGSSVAIWFSEYLYGITMASRHQLSLTSEETPHVSEMQRLTQT